MWTDDASQMLCLAEVLIAYNGRVDSDQLNWMIEFWWSNGCCIGYSRQLNQLRKNLGHDGAFGLGGTSRGTM